jgi:predicted transcriptional regulator
VEKSSQFGPLSNLERKCTHTHTHTHTHIYIYIEKTKGAIVGETKAVHVNIYLEKTKGEKDGPTLTNFSFRL